MSEQTLFDVEREDTVSGMALIALKYIISNEDIVLDLRSAVYMFHLAQSLVKHIESNKGYTEYVGE